MFSLEQLIERVRDFRPSLDSKRVRDAFDFVEELYKDRRRLSGDPYVTHFLSVLDILLPLKPDEDTVIAALLHGVLSDTDISLDVLRKKFGPHVASLIESLQTLRTMRPHPDMIDVENFRQMILALAKDLRVLLIRFAHSIHNLETIDYLKDPHAQKALARECLEIYAPLASRLGIYTFKSRLEDLSFRYLHPQEYAYIEDQLGKFGKQKGRFIDEIVQKLKTFLRKNNVDAAIDGRFKSIYSIHRKLKRKGRMSIDDIFDVFAIRVVLPTQMSADRESIDQLYMLLGLLHSEWTPLANRFKDYVAVSKPNGYQSLHTTVIGLSPKHFNQPVEIQIRSERMHRDAEYGVASHWLYEDTKAASTGFAKDSFLQYVSEKDVAAPSKRFHSQMEWLRGLSKLQEQMSEDQDIIDSLRLDLFNDRIFVLTPTGEVKDLPVGATPVDFAYSVHTDVGHRCSMAKVNGRLVPLDYELKNGEVVEIVLKPKPNPKPLWLSFLKTNSAKMKIRSWFHSQDREFAFREGRDLLNKQLLRFGKAKLDESLSVLQHYMGRDLSARERQTLVESVGNGSIAPYTLVRRLFASDEPLPPVTPPVSSRPSKTDAQLPLEQRILLGGESGLPLRIAQCCSPKESDQILGYITRDNAATILRSDCKFFGRAHAYRILQASWKASTDQSLHYRVSIFIEAVNRIGMIRDITTVISDLHINIVHFGYKDPLRKETPARGVVYLVLLDLLNIDQLDRLFNKLEQVSGVLNVYRS